MTDQNVVVGSMRAWEKVLLRDSEAYADLKTWLSDILARELTKLRRAGRDGHDHQAGVVDGVEMILFQVQANERERQSNS